jgi:ABC-type Fe3+/spermidine/putrescine transport system ATPase subunit
MNQTLTQETPVHADDGDGRAILEVDGLQAAHGSNPVVKDVSFTVREGEFVTLLGPSGCGKTTTLRCVAGLHRAAGGSIRIGGRLVADARTHVRPEHRGLNMVFQSYALWPHMSVFQNVAYGLKAQRIERKEIERRVTEMLELVGLGGYGDRSATDLSGGQQQRVVLARGLATRPRLLLLDEPLSNLDSELRGRMRTEIHTLQQELGLTTLYVTHDRTEALAMSDRVVVLREGVVQQVGDPTDLYDAPVNQYVAQALGPINVIGGVVEPVTGGIAAARLTAVEGAPVVPIAADRPAAPGTAIEVLARPEALRWTRAGGDAAPLQGMFRATVAVAEFLGNRSEIICASNGHEIRIEFDGRPGDLGPGDRIDVGFRDDDDERRAPSWQPTETKG